MSSTTSIPASRTAHAGSAGERAGRRVREVIVITGASAGLGRAISREFARPGAALGLIARDPARLEDACREARDAGAEAIPLPLDVADADAVEQAAALVEQRLGPIDIWVNNAMVSVFAPVHETTAAEFARVTAVTYLGVVHGTLAALRRMRPRDRGTIVQVGSALAYRGIPLQAAYCASKHAIQGFCDSLRCELLHDHVNVHVSMVQMPALDTPQFDWSRSRMPRRAQPVLPLYDPAVGAQAVRWAVEARKREVWLGWPTVTAIVGNQLAPGYADRYLARMGYDAQQTNEPEDPNRCDNLWKPCPGDYGARGRFGRFARHFSSQLWLSRHRWGLAIAAAATAAGAATYSALSGSRQISKCRDRREDARRVKDGPARVSRA